MWLTLDRDSKISLTRQVYERVKQNILDGKFRAGEKLPSSRVAARETGVSRVVIVEAYEQLLAEGYVIGKQGAGTYVNSGLAIKNRPPELSGGNIKPAPAAQSKLIDFKPGVPALDCFPIKKWAMLARKVFLDADSRLLGYQTPEGLPRLRQSIAEYLFRNRGLNCSANQIVITSGAAQALVLAVNLISINKQTPERLGVIEDPASPDIRKSLQNLGVDLFYTPVDSQGIIPEYLPKQKRISLIYVTPSHQFPLGGVLPVRRRIQLIEYAAQNGGWIIEDDYDSEFRYDGSPLSSLYELDPERVIYIGTFSKTMFPGLRIGYCVLPSRFVEQGRNMKWLMDIHTSIMDQLVLDAFIREGFFERHLRNIKGLYKKRRDHLIQTLETAFQGQVSFQGLSTGLHLTAIFSRRPGAASSLTPLIQEVHEAQKRGVKIYPASFYTIDQKQHSSKMIFGFSNLDEQKITQGIAILADIV